MFEKYHDHTLQTNPLCSTMKQSHRTVTITRHQEDKEKLSIRRLTFGYEDLWIVFLTLFLPNNDFIFDAKGIANRIFCRFR